MSIYWRRQRDPWSIKMGIASDLLALDCLPYPSFQRELMLVRMYPGRATNKE